MTSPTVPTLFTLGYQQRSIDDFLRLLLAAEVDVLVDVRETPWSHKAGFSKRRLAEALQAHGVIYVHARFAGNPKRLRTSAPTHAACLRLYADHLDANPVIVEVFDEMVGRYLDEGKRVCVTCYERHPDDCHRGILTNRWRQGFWREVEHLGADETYRLIRA